MKKYWHVVLAIIVLFVSCYEINEEIVINENGSGTYVTKMDMSALIQMMQTMAGEEELSKSGLDRAIDTLIRMKDVIDTAKNISEEEKRLYADGTLKLQLNIKENIFKSDVSFPFRSHADLEKLMMGAGSSSMGSVFKKLFSKPDSTQQDVAVQDQGLEQINNIFDVTIDKHTIVRKLNKQKYDELMQRPEMAQVKQMSTGGVEVLYTTTIKLPAKVKKADNPMVKISEDKRTVTIRYDLLKLFDTPEKFSYTIEY
jgi:hypothetical protein